MTLRIEQKVFFLTIENVNNSTSRNATAHEF